MSKLNRFALSALSRSQKAFAVPEEIMIHKNTGEVVIKTKTGDVISYDSLARLNSHIEDVTNLSYMVGITGDMSSIELDNILLPEVISENTNLVPVPLLLKNKDLDSILISADVDALIISDVDSLVEKESDIQIKLRIVNNSTSAATTYTIKKPVSFLNGYVIDMVETTGMTLTTLKNYTLFLDDFRVTRNTGYAAATSLRNILHSILVIIK